MLNDLKGIWFKSSLVFVQLKSKPMKEYMQNATKIDMVKLKMTNVVSVDMKV